MTRQLLDQHCCKPGDTTGNYTLLRDVASLSRRMKAVVGAAYAHGQCARLACRAVIRPYEEYYVLGGGKVVNCRRCACDATYTIKLGRRDETFKRGWDQTAKAVYWTKLQRIMI